MKVGEFTNVIFCCVPAKSVQVVPLPGYDEELPASNRNVSPSVTRGKVPPITDSPPPRLLRFKMVSELLVVVFIIVKLIFFSG